MALLKVKRGGKVTVTYTYLLNIVRRSETRTKQPLPCHTPKRHLLKKMSRGRELEHSPTTAAAAAAVFTRLISRGLYRSLSRTGVRLIHLDCTTNQTRCLAHCSRPKSSVSCHSLEASVTSNFPTSSQQARFKPRNTHTNTLLPTPRGPECTGPTGA